MKGEDKSKLVSVFDGSLWEAELVKGLLKDRGIESAIQNGLLVNNTLPETAIAVTVLVNEGACLCLRPGIDLAPGDWEVEVVTRYRPNSTTLYKEPRKGSLVFRVV